MRKIRVGKKAISNMLGTLILMAIVLSAGVFVWNFVIHEGNIVNGGAHAELSNVQITALPGGEGYFTGSIINSGAAPLEGVKINIYPGNIMIPVSAPVQPGQTLSLSHVITSGIALGSTYSVVLTGNTPQGSFAISQQVMAT